MMLERFTDANVFIYTLWGLGAFGLLFRMIVSTYLKRMIKASSNMETTRKKNLRLIKQRSDNSKSLGISIRNSDAFVDKYIGRFRLLGFPIESWKRTSNTLSMGVIMILSAAMIYYAGEGRAGHEALKLFSNGAFVCAFLYGIENIFLIENKIGLMKANIKDYIDNVSGPISDMGQIQLRNRKRQESIRTNNDSKNAEIAAAVALETEASTEGSQVEAKSNEDLLESFLKGLFS